MILTKTSLTLLLLSLLISGCGLNEKTKRDPDLAIEGYNPPKFRISGQGKLDSITVSGPDKERKQPEGDAAPYRKEYWVIMPKEEYDLSHFKELGLLIYGQTPEVFKQWVPQMGEVQPLIEGETYSVQLRTKDGPAVSRFFVLRDGKIIATGDGS